MSEKELSRESSTNPRRSGGNSRLEELKEAPLRTPEFVMLSDGSPYDAPTEVLPRLYLCGEAEGATDRRKNMALGVSLVVCCNAKRGTAPYVVYGRDTSRDSEEESRCHRDVGKEEFYRIVEGALV